VPSIRLGAHRECKLIWIWLISYYQYHQIGVLYSKLHLSNIEVVLPYNLVKVGLTLVRIFLNLSNAAYDIYLHKLSCGKFAFFVPSYRLGCLSFALALIWLLLESYLYWACLSKSMISKVRSDKPLVLEPTPRSISDHTYGSQPTMQQCTLIARQRTILRSKQCEMFLSCLAHTCSLSLYTYGSGRLELGPLS